MTNTDKHIIKFIKIEFIDDEQPDANNSEILIVPNGKFEEAISVIKQTRKSWPELDAEEKWDTYGGYFDYLSDWLGKKNIPYNWLNYDTTFEVHNN